MDLQFSLNGDMSMVFGTLAKVLPTCNGTLLRVQFCLSCHAIQPELHPNSA